MIGDHYEDWELFAYHDANPGSVDVAAVALHLVSCRGCRDNLDALRDLSALLRDPGVHAAAERRPRKPDPRRILEARAMVRRVELEKRVAEETFDELMRMPLEEWPGYLASDPDRRTEALIDRMVREARTEYDRRPGYALELLKAAAGVANTFTNALAFARQHGTVAKERANALRRLSRYQEALAELDWAETFMAQLPVHAFDLALVEWGRATVLFYMTRYAEALPFVRRAARTLRQFGDIPRAEQVRLLEAGILFEMGDASTALAMNERLAAYFEQIGDTETLARVVGNMAACEAVLDHPEAAHRYASRAMSLYDALGKPTERIRVASTLGNLFLRRGQFSEARRRLRAAAAAFHALGMEAESGQALLDVVEMHVARGEWDQAISLAQELATLFTGAGVPVHAARAYAYLREAVEAERATVALVGYIRTYLEAADDARAFVPPAS